MDARIGASHTDSLVLVIGGSKSIGGQSICSGSISVRIGASFADSLLLLVGNGKSISSGSVNVRIGTSFADSLLVVIGGGNWAWIVCRLKALSNFFAWSMLLAEFSSGCCSGIDFGEWRGRRSAIRIR